MPERICTRIALVPILAALALALFAGTAPRAQADDNLPVFTSAIDVTRGRIQIKAVAPDRDSGRPVEVPLPPGLLPPKMQQLLTTPLGAQMDQYWNVTPDPKTGKTPRQMACEGNPATMTPGIPSLVQDEIKKIGDGYSAYDISCNLATTGIVVTKLVGDTTYLSYQILNNRVEFYVTTPFTCHRDHGTFLCPNDPQFSVTFASEIWTVVRTPALCQFTAEGGTVNLHAVQIDSHNFSGDVAKNIIDTLFLGNKFTAAELALQATQRQVPLPLDDSFKDLRESAPCKDRNHPLAPVVAAFREVETDIERGDIVLRVIHPTIAAPRFQNVDLPYGPDTCKQGFVWREAFDGDHVCVTPETRAQAAADNAQAAARREPGGGPYGPNTCKQGYVWREARPEDLVCVTPQVRAQTRADNAQAAQRRVLGSPEFPSFTRPTITVPPVVAAGAAVQVTGQFFPPNTDPTVLTLSLERDTTSACNGGATELEWGPAGGQMRVEKLPASGNVSSCAFRYEVKNLTPATAYQFRARDCDALTCSQWSAPLRLTTGAAGSGRGRVVLTLDGPAGQADGGTALGTATVNAQGRFEATVTIPAGTTAGTHTIYAVSGEARAQEGLQVTAAGGGGGTATIILTGTFFGDTGCPMRPLPDYAQKITVDETFSLFGTGFAPGAVTLYLDSATGISLGTATAGADGTFCQDTLKGPPASQVGKHTIVAVQGGTVRASIPVEVIYPSVVR